MIPEPLPDGDLWACHACKMIGSEAAATAHRIALGHDVERVDEETAREVRRERQRQQDDFIVSLIGLGRSRVLARHNQQQPEEGR